jgi:hypothetical protein
MLVLLFGVMLYDPLILKGPRSFLQTSQDAWKRLDYRGSLCHILDQPSVSFQPSIVLNRPQQPFLPFDSLSWQVAWEEASRHRLQ